MTRTVATHPRLRTLRLRLLRGSSWTKLQALCFYGKALSVMEAVVEILFNLYKQTTVTSRIRPLKLELVIKYNYSIRAGSIRKSARVRRRERGPLTLMVLLHTVLLKL